LQLLDLLLGGRVPSRPPITSPEAAAKAAGLTETNANKKKLVQCVFGQFLIFWGCPINVFSHTEYSKLDN
jgi:hypothetical protein